MFSEVSILCWHQNFLVYKHSLKIMQNDKGKHKVTLKTYSYTCFYPIDGFLMFEKYSYSFQRSSCLDSAVNLA
jgi:hypothetical protein